MPDLETGIYNDKTVVEGKKRLDGKEEAKIGKVVVSSKLKLW